jgi:hypothetical protein
VEDPGVVDDHLHVAELARDRRDPIAVGDIELDGHEAGVGDGGHVAHRGVVLRRAAVEQRVRERLAHSAVGARDEDPAVSDVHCCLLAGFVLLEVGQASSPRAARTSIGPVTG